MPLRPRLSKLQLTEDRVIFGLGCVFLPEPHTWKAHLTSTPLAGAPAASVLDSEGHSTSTLESKVSTVLRGDSQLSLLLPSTYAQNVSHPPSCKFRLLP